MIPAPIEQVLTLLQDDQLLLDLPRYRNNFGAPQSFDLDHYLAPFWENGGLGLSVREEPQSGTLGSMRAGALTAVTKSAVVASASSVSRDNVAIANAPPIGCLLGKISPQGNIHPFSWVNSLLVLGRVSISCQNWTKLTLAS